MPNPLNLCAQCGEDFGSLALFDRHMVGKPGDRRRGCLTPEQMTAKGWRKGARGRWLDPASGRMAGKAVTSTSGEA